MRMCRRCLSYLPLAAFRARYEGLQSYCKACENELKKVRRDLMNDAYTADETAEMVLRLVSYLATCRVPEPTGTGYIADDVRPYVMKRSDQREFT